MLCVMGYLDVSGEESLMELNIPNIYGTVTPHLLAGFARGGGSNHKIFYDRNKNASNRGNRRSK